MQKCVLLLLCLAAPAFALDVAGTRLADRVHLGGGDLQLNGAGVRSILFLDLYVAALYLDVKSASGAKVLADVGEKRMALHLLRDIDANRLHSGLSKAIAANHTLAELSALRVQIDEFALIFRKIGEIREGDAVTLDYLPGSGTVVGVNGVDKGMVKGASFYGALLKIWLGDQPVQDDLKQKLLGAR